MPPNHIARWLERGLPTDIDLPDWARQLLRDARTGHLATVGPDGMPHVVPVCYVVLDGQIVTPIDAKPKTGKRLSRLRNIEHNPQAALVVDRYDEEWTHLAWVQVRGEARLVGPDSALHRGATEALRVKYPQYRTMQLDDSPSIAIPISVCRFWSWS